MEDDLGSGHGTGYEDLSDDLIAGEGEGDIHARPDPAVAPAERDLAVGRQDGDVK